MQSQIVPNQRGAFAVRSPLDDFTAGGLQPDGGLPSSFADAAWCGFGASDFPKFCQLGMNEPPELGPQPFLRGSRGPSFGNISKTDSVVGW